MKRVVLFLMITTFLVSCGEPTINGKLIDNFDNPIVGAKVEIEGTSFTTKTNSKGEYEINFVPGEIKLKYSKENYLDTIFNVKISTKDDFPAQIVKTYKVPKKGEMFFVSKEGYQELPTMIIREKASTYNSVQGREYGTPQYLNHIVNTYYIKSVMINNLIPKFGKGDMKFADTDEKNVTLVKLKKEGSEYVVGTNDYVKDGYEYYFGNRLDITNSFNNKISYSSMEYTYTSFKNRNKGNTFGIWQVNLKPGVYAFICIVKSKKKPFIVEGVRPFIVE